MTKESLRWKECQPHPEGGKEHLYRYCACDLQALQAKADDFEKMLNELARNGHYELCPILNSESRFDREVCTCGHLEACKILSKHRQKEGGA